MEINSGVTKTVVAGQVTLDSLTVTKYQKNGTQTAQLRQVLTTTSEYPTQKIKSEHSDNLFDAVDFGIETRSFTNTKNRVTFMDVPTTVSKDDIEGLLSPENCIHRIVGNHPILTEAKSYGIKVGNITLDEIADQQVMKYINEKGKSVLDLSLNGKVQYKTDSFSLVQKEDDLSRLTSAPKDFYASAAIQAELNGQVKVQAVVEGDSLTGAIG